MDKSNIVLPVMKGMFTMKELEPDGKPKTLADFASEVTRARHVLEESVEEERIASHNATVARNKYNEACKAFDKAVEEFRKEGPRETDWSRNITQQR